MGIWPRFYKRTPVFIHRQCQFGIIPLADGDFPVPDYTAAAIGNHHGVGARRDILQIKTAVFIRPTGFAADVHRHAGKRIAVRIGHRSADAVAFVVRRSRGVFINRPEYGVQSCGYYFLPEAAVRIWGWQGFSWLAPLALTVYLVMNSRRDFWRLLGLAAAWSAGALLAAYLVSLSGGWYLSKYINFAVSDLFEYGIYDGLLYWFTLWLAVVCALISAYWLMHSLVRQRTQARTLELKNRLLLDSYHTIEQKMRDSAALRHEFLGMKSGIRTPLWTLCTNRRISTGLANFSVICNSRSHSFLKPGLRTISPSTLFCRMLPPARHRQAPLLTHRCIFLQN